jgi:hypothetical protein
MKLLIALFLSIRAIYSSLMFELRNNHPRCYVEEFFHHSVAMIKWKIVGLPEDSAKKQSNMMLK